MMQSNHFKLTDLIPRTEKDWGYAATGAVGALLCVTVFSFGYVFVGMFIEAVTTDSDRVGEVVPAEEYFRDNDGVPAIAPPPYKTYDQ